MNAYICIVTEKNTSHGNNKNQFLMQFLHRVASDLYEKLDGNFERLTIVFPNKRAGLFFDQELAKIADRPVWKPKYVSISELFSGMSDSILADQILLVCLLYKSYVETTGRTDETLDKFYTWGEMMLSDFDDIDNNLARADKLFQNIKDLDELTSFDFLSEHQIETIKQYFTSFNPDKNTKLKEKFLSIWNTLCPTYNAFKETLRSNGLAYEGMLKRNVIESLKNGQSDDLLKDNTYAIIGFNVLNETELELFKYIKEKKQAFFYWDYDVAYMHAGDDKLENRRTNEAGRFIMDNIRALGSELPSNEDVYNCMKEEKSVSFIASPTDSAQAQYVTEWTNKNITDSDRPLNETAVVLCDEALLESVLHAIPQKATNDGKSRDIVLNVTMGYPLSQTPICSFVNALMNLHLSGSSRYGVWKASYVMPVIRHPYVKRMSPDESERLISEMTASNRLFPTTEYLSADDFLSSLFFEDKSNSCLLTSLATILERIGMSYDTEGGSETLDQLYIESVYKMHSVVQRLRTIQETGLLNVTQETLVRLVRQMMNNISIPFHGEPAVGLQVMGLLETRNIDFKNVLLLSTNDDKLPGSVRRSSFIPYSLRDAYGMTTMDKQVSLYAYYFYRLIQRAENVSIVYNNTASDFAKGEMSRFMNQLLVESNKLMPQLKSIDLVTLTSDNTSVTYQPIKAKKSEKVMRKLLSTYTADLDGGNEHKGKILSPSAINCYIDCQLKFFLTYVVGIREEEELTEEIADNVFGNIFHKVMETLYRPYIESKKPLTQSILLAMSKDSALIEQYTDMAFNEEFFHCDKNSRPTYSGKQLVTKDVIMRYIKAQLRSDAMIAPLWILGVEKFVKKTLKISSNGKELNINVGGIIDRIDKASIDGECRLRIVDYKTSSSAQTAKTIEDLFNSQLDRRPYHLTQLFYYSSIVSDLVKEPISPALCYPKRHAKNDVPPVVEIGKEPVYDFNEYREEYNKTLGEVISSIFDPSKDFQQALNDHPCKYCDFALMCGRKEDEQS